MDFFSYFFNISSKSSNGLIITLILISSAIIIQLPSLWIERVPAYNNATSYISLTTIGIFFRSLNPSFSRISNTLFFYRFINYFMFFY